MADFRLDTAIFCRPVRTAEHRDLICPAGDSGQAVSGCQKTAVTILVQHLASLIDPDRDSTVAPL
jgi:hypothetical protein